MIKIEINTDKCLRPIKPMHAVNNIPRMKSPGINKIEDDRILGSIKDVIPYARLHDTAFLYPYHKMVDVTSVFPSFEADENDENSYDFTFTDLLMKTLEELHIKPFYRLGVSIENFAKVKAYNIYPPKDYIKWAKICEHIIMHYNEGWANGMKMGIEYWEIWNEPENYPEIEDNQEWKGTFEEYMRLYEVSSNYLKNRFPDLKIGGYASCGFYYILEKASSEQANVSSRTKYFVDCINEFLEYISSEEHKSPLDFFSWHSYSGVTDNVKYAEYARNLLDKYGFTKTESILNEWNPGIGLRGTIQDASNIVSNMIELQKSPLGLLMYYDLRINTTYCGLFSPVGEAPTANAGKLLPAYYVFKAFNELYHRGTEVESKSDAENIHVLSAADETTGNTLITNNSDVAQDISILGLKNIEKALSVTDINKLSEVTISDNTYTLSPYETILISSDK